MKLGLLFPALSGALLVASPASIAGESCPTNADLENGITSTGGIDGSTLKVTVPPSDWIEGLGMKEDPDLVAYRFLELEYPLGSRSFYRSSQRLAYRGLIDRAISSHRFEASLVYRGSVEDFFPLDGKHTTKFDVLLHSTPFSGTGSLELETIDRDTISIGSCEYELILLKMKITSQLFEGKEPQFGINETSIIYYIPELESPFAIVHSREGDVIWVQGMFDTVMASPHHAESGK